MRALKPILLAGILSLILTGCATVPDKSEMQRLSGGEVRDALVGNTMTYKANWGRWAEYYAPSGMSYGRASGSWGSERATANYEIGSDGEMCGTYSGDPEWASGNEYCDVMYMDADGNYYSESTQRTYETEKIGRILRVEIKDGDAYGLAG